jgi:pyruvate/2-oxoglutarate dehydrogenase complex dihydrolipoamide dehydrogenase (E3) component
MNGNGIQAANLQIDWPELMRFKRSFTEPVPKRREEGFEKVGIAAFHGTARLLKLQYKWPICWDSRSLCTAQFCARPS